MNASEADAHPHGDDVFYGYFRALPIPAYLWRLGEGGTLTLEDLNAAALEAWGAGVTELVGRAAADMYADAPEVVEMLARSAGGETFTHQFRPYWTRLSGEARHMDVTFVHVPPDAVIVHVDDVTERIRTSRELERSRSQARAILEASADPILLLDREGAILEMNAALAESLGRPGDDLRGHDLYELFPPEVGRRRREAALQAMEAHEPSTLEDVAGGRTYRSRIYPVVEADGRSSGVVVYAEDVTDELRAWEALVASREAHLEAQRVAQLGHWEWDVEDGASRRSDEACRILGLDQASVRPGVTGFLDCVHPEDRTAVRTAVDGLLEGGHYDVECRIVRPDGAIRWVRDRARLGTLDDGKRRIIGTMLDITDLKEVEASVRQKEAELRALLEAVPDALCVTRGGRFLAWNGALESLSGRSADELREMDPVEIFAPEDRTRAREHLRGDDAGAAAHEPQSYRCLRVGRDPVPVEASSAPVDYQGEPALITTIRDVSARRRTQEDLARSRDRLRALARHLQTVREDERVAVARDLHDDLGGILTALKIEVSQLRLGARDLATALKDMDDLLDDAIDMGRRIVTGLRPGVLDDLGLGPAVEWLAEDFEARYGIASEVEVPTDHERLPDHTRTAVFRILQESLTNVVRHADAKRVHIALAIDRDSVDLKVRDDGRGLELENLSPDDRHGVEGMKERALACGGTLEIESTPRGTVVRVVIPRS